MHTTLHKKRVLIVINALQIGGTARQLLSLVPAIDDFDVTIMYYDGSLSDLHAPLEKAGVRVVCIDKNKGLLRYMITSLKFMRKERFDVVHAWEGTANMYGRIPAILARVPVILGGMRAEKGFNNKLIAIINSALNLCTSGWIVNSTSLVSVLKARLRFCEHLPITVVRNGLQPAESIDYRIKEQTDYDEIRSHAKIVGAVGRLVPGKNYDMYLHAAERILKIRDDVEFWLIGDGDLLDKYRNWVNDRNLQASVKVLGARRDVDVALSRISVFAHTSDTEGCPNVIIEALRAAKPVISTACTDMSGLVEHGVNGFLIEPHDEDAFVESLTKVLDMPSDELQKMGDESQRLFEHGFLARRSAEHMQEAYHASLSRV